MRAVLPRVPSVGDDHRHNPSARPILFMAGKQKVGEADPLPMVMRVIRPIAAASISTNRQLGLMALWKDHAMPVSGLCPHEGRFYANAFRDIY